jgi:hypothetical protein
MTRFFYLAYCRDRFDDPRTLYAEGAVEGMEVDEGGFGADDDYWPLPTHETGIYPLIVFEGDVETADEHHAKACGCQNPAGKDCQNPNLGGWSWYMAGEWRKATIADLLRAGFSFDAPAVGLACPEEAGSTPGRYLAVTSLPDGL